MAWASGREASSSSAFSACMRICGMAALAGIWLVATITRKYTPYSLCASANLGSSAMASSNATLILNPQIVDLADVGMIQSGDGAGFLLESRVVL